MRKLIVSFILCLSAVSQVFAFGPTVDESRFDPTVLKIDEEKFLGKTLPDITMTDWKGNSLTLAGLAGKPLILSIIYYRCVSTCPVLNEGLAEALGNTGLRLGEDYNVVTLSFKADESPLDAEKFRSKLAVKMKNKLPDNFDKWIFAVAKEEDIRKLTGALGYKFFYSEQDKIYVHPNVYIFVSPREKITRYLFGLFPLAVDLKIALLEAADGKIGRSSMINVLTLACYHYDPSIGGYKLNLPFIFGMIGFALALFTALVVVLFARKLKRQKKAY